MLFIKRQFFVCASEKHLMEKLDKLAGTYSTDSLKLNFYHRNTLELRTCLFVKLG